VPASESGPRAVPDPEPNDGRAIGLTKTPCGKVLVLCQDGGSLADGVVPDLGVIRIAQSEFEYVVRVMAGLIQQ
jgi:hypothetical protein